MNQTSDVATLIVSVAGVSAGLTWLALLRSRATSWTDALAPHQIQALNAALLIGLGIVVGVTALADLNPGLLPTSAVLPVGVALALAVEGPVMVAARRQPRG